MGPQLEGATAERVLVIGLDCLAPALAFGRHLDAMPALRGLMESGTWGELRSCDPPITVPAWMVMATGRDPGSLGVYGFRHRRGRSYVDAWTATSTAFDTPAVWDALAARGAQTCLVGFPPSYPPRPLSGWRVGCFLIPDGDGPIAYPAALGDEVRRVCPDYRFDVEFRVEARDRLLRELCAMTDGHFDVAEHLAQTKPWTLFWLVEIGVDRVHHAFWKFSDESHPRYEPSSPFESAIRDYYAHVDARVASLLEHVGDETAVLLVSDHGAKAMRGAIAVNVWLAEEGWLALDAAAEPGTPLERCPIDWSRTRAWAWGGYYARVFLNVRGREPRGVIKPTAAEAALDELADALRSITAPDGSPLDTRTYRPAELYRQCRGDAPDLMVYFDDLSWRAAGTLGSPGPYLRENDTGPDDAVHAHEGCFVLVAPDRPPAGPREGASIYDVAPTILQLLGVPVEGFAGSPI